MDPAESLSDKKKIDVLDELSDAGSPCLRVGIDDAGHSKKRIDRHVRSSFSAKGYNELRFRNLRLNFQN